MMEIGALLHVGQFLTSTHLSTNFQRLLRLSTAFEAQPVIFCFQSMYSQMRYVPGRANGKHCLDSKAVIIDGSEQPTEPSQLMIDWQVVQVLSAQTPACRFSAMFSAHQLYD